MAPPAADCDQGAEAPRQFNVEQAIQEFLADPAIMSMRLPHMTTGQRRHAKQVASTFPELKVESFGLGADRHLHLFKIDETSKASDTSGSTQFGSFGIFDPEEHADASPTTDSDRSGKDESPSCVPAANPVHRQLPPLPEDFRNLPVRNTFLHIEAPPADERVVQSMPHGMFRQHLLAETSAAASGGAMQPPVPPPAMPAPTMGVMGAPLIAPGTQVLVEGLVRTPEFNGLIGVVQFFEVDAGRYSVLLSSPGHPSGLQWAKIKAENLCVPLLPPPFGVPNMAAACGPLPPGYAPAVTPTGQALLAGA